MTDSAKCRILLVDDEEGLRSTLSLLLKNEGYQVDAAAGHVDAIACLQTAHYDLAFVDIMLAGENGIDLLRDIKAISPSTQVVMFTGHPEVNSAVAAVRLGAFDYITKPVRKETLLLIARHALKNKEMHDDLEQSRANMDAILRTVSDSIVMVDKNGRLAHFNSTAEKVCGYSRDLIGSDAAAISLGCCGFCRAALLETLSGNAPREIRRHECRTPEGKNRIVGLTATPVIETDGTVSGAVAVIRDESQLVELEQALQKRERFQGIVGASAPMQKVYSLIEDLADVPTTVLIYGESGTGKELVAAALHYSGARAAEPFVKVNCSALSESLLESELFGHVRGAFTGAIANKVGRFQKADKGTLFLDEIADISPAIQMRLLRVLQEGEFERVGESTSHKVDVRMLAATNRDLAAMVKEGTFREDLYYRLDVVRVRAPALRERLDDLDLLVAHFIAKFNRKLKRKIQGVSDDVLALFHRHTWPGNVRELEHAVERACILCKSNIITVQDLPQDLIDSARAAIESSSQGAALPITVKQKLTLEEALELSGGNKSHAANLLGVSRLTVYRQIKKSRTT
ncbi:sigma-54-dependent Fis family transcriptional regulator [Desulfobulbus sp.]|uniref:sigma-54 dependent transcriptional regulator n=1 Tax=Desulfobulbus sp. TaxID=895 RepID=UPI0027B8CCAF|nr:sigma-54-dependent Fis family transcriptional regulator [Desulfobulbus sp.]